jgi:hypothetical protein
MVNGTPYAESALPDAQLKPQQVILSTIPNKNIWSSEKRLRIWKNKL